MAANNCNNLSSSMTANLTECEAVDHLDLHRYPHDPVPEKDDHPLKSGSETEQAAEPEVNNSHLHPPPPPPFNTDAVHQPALNVPSSSQKMSQKELRLHLVQAIEKNKPDVIQDLLVKGVQLDCVILFNKTPLTYSIEMHAFHIAKLMVRSGANVCAREPIANARQPIHIAADLASLDMLEYLLEHGADVDGRDGCGATALMQASFAGHLEAVLLLHKFNADLSAGDLVGRTALHRAAEGRHKAVISYLVTSGVDINARDSFGWTPVYHSIVFGHTDMVKFLLDCGISLSGTDCNNRSPLTIACNRLCPPNIKIVLSTSMDFHKRERKIPTYALHVVLNSQDCTQCEFVTMEMLVNAGARLNLRHLTEFFQLCPNLALARKQVLLHYLFLCGCIGQQEDIDLASSSTYLPQLKAWREQQKSLQQLCRLAVRTHLSVLGCRHISNAIKKLPIPAALKNMLNISEFAQLYPDFMSKFSCDTQMHNCCS